jgi:hypothetical protein
VANAGVGGGIIVVACTQCGKAAIVLLGDNPLCVDCFLKFQQAIQLQDDKLVQQINFLMDMAEMTADMPGLFPRLKVPQSIVHKGSTKFNNIHIDRSVIGSINTGDAKRIDVAVSDIKGTGNEDLATNLAQFTEAVIAERNLNNELRDQLLEQISFLASQSTLPKEQRKPGVLKAVMSAVKEAVSAIASLSALWGKLQPLLERIFG